MLQERIAGAEGARRLPGGHRPAQVGGAGHAGAPLADRRTRSTDRGCARDVLHHRLLPALSPGAGAPRACRTRRVARPAIGLVPADGGEDARAIEEVEWPQIESTGGPSENSPLGCSAKNTVTGDACAPERAPVPGHPGAFDSLSITRFPITQPPNLTVSACAARASGGGRRRRIRCPAHRRRPLPRPSDRGSSIPDPR
jgi:hypothetical protein